MKTFPTFPASRADTPTRRAEKLVYQALEASDLDGLASPVRGRRPQHGSPVGLRSLAPGHWDLRQPETLGLRLVTPAFSRVPLLGFLGKCPLTRLAPMEFLPVRPSFAPDPVILPAGLAPLLWGSIGVTRGSASGLPAGASTRPRTPPLPLRHGHF